MIGNNSRTFRLTVSNQPLCVLFPNSDFTEVVGHMHYEDKLYQMKLYNLLGYFGDDNSYCNRILEDLKLGVQTQTLYDAFQLPIKFDYTYVYADFVKVVQRLIVNGRLKNMLHL